MRLGKEVLEADLYGELGLLPDATDAEIRVAYRNGARASHPDLNRSDPSAAPRMTRLNIAAKVLLDPALRRAYDRVPRGEKAAAKPSRAPKRDAWFERREQSTDGDWSAPPPTRREEHAAFGSFSSELRGREGQFGLQVQALVESLSSRQQLGVAALLFAIALGLIVVSRPPPGTPQPTSVHIGSVYP